MYLLCFAAVSDAVVLHLFTIAVAIQIFIMLNLQSFSALNIVLSSFRGVAKQNKKQKICFNEI